MNNFLYCSSHLKKIVLLETQERIEEKLERFLGYMQSNFSIKIFTLSHQELIKHVCAWCILWRFLKCGSTQETNFFKSIICELNKPAKWNYLLFDITSPVHETTPFVKQWWDAQHVLSLLNLGWVQIKQYAWFFPLLPVSYVHRPTFK